MRDVGERSGVDEDRSTLERLHQRGLNGVAHEDGERARGADVLRGYGFAGARRPYHHGPEPPAHVGQVGRQGENRHDLAGYRNVEPGVAGESEFIRTLTDRDLAEHAVVGIHHAPPGDGVRIDSQANEAAALLLRHPVRVAGGYAELLLAHPHAAGEEAPSVADREEALEEKFVALTGLVQHPYVDRRRQQVVGRGDGMDVPGEVQVEVLHGDDLAVAAARRSALDAEGRTLAGLADARDRPLAEVGAHRLGETHGGCGLALAQGRWGDRRYVDVLAVRRAGKPFEYGKPHLRLVGPMHLELLAPEAELRGDRGDGGERGFLGDLDVGGDGRTNLQRGIAAGIGHWRGDSMVSGRWRRIPGIRRATSRCSRMRQKDSLRRVIWE